MQIADSNNCSCGTAAEVHATAAAAAISATIQSLVNSRCNC